MARGVEDGGTAEDSLLVDEEAAAAGPSVQVESQGWLYDTVHRTITFYSINVFLKYNIEQCVKLE